MTLRAGKDSWSITDGEKTMYTPSVASGAGKDRALGPDRKNALETELYYSKNHIGFFLEVMWRPESLDKKARDILNKQ